MTNKEKAFAMEFLSNDFGSNYGVDRPKPDNYERASFQLDELFMVIHFN
ncbi:MAG: hypothetical protein AAGA66_05370 [Bacteroidota bacterium]